ncbi:hypothetical protein LOY97_004300 [Ophidiomyces ophidiicola]|nr:hypothetical protein LOZ49_005265 [Ophidiomyces ophidiicola]KAI2011238.1 hypothetical protein LOZ46_006175 [Ophidiomyces ophidiicola]KAI2130792.1 hypothetical protein LOZ29_005652 [Ophidiomyces ophidiicola]KAI2133398.1 hypothetical protein LOZ28_005425 [Ophidiomyces ophidiicola]KAI2211334.1 hypothetical protein LOZ15_005729 [Ophidiomyces ophidiicola]
MTWTPLRSSRRTHASICQFCQFSTFSPKQFSLSSQPSPLPARPKGPRKTSLRPRNSPTRFGFLNVSARTLASLSATPPQNDPDHMLRDALQDSHAIITATTLPTEETILHLFERCKIIADIALSDHDISTQKTENNATSSLLDLEDENGASNKAPAKTKVIPKKNFRQRAIIAVSSLLNEVICDPKVFISPNILREYTIIQTQLKKANHFPEVFSLYANKPAPQANGSVITYRAENPKAAKNAIPQDLADMALDVAIEQKNLPLAFAIIDKTFCAPAFHRAKILRKASLPIAGLASTPLAAYGLASYAATFQNTINPTTSTWMAFSAIMAYVTCTSSLGLIALATANDQMRRVVWLQGTPLRYRWLREEERCAMDKIAMAWGFKDPWMQGEEEGEEWESLRELLGMRGMILDKTDLMDGME